MISGTFYRNSIIPLRLETGAILPTGEGDVSIVVKDVDGTVRTVAADVQNHTAAFAYVPAGDQFGQVYFQVKATFEAGIMYGETETMVIMDNFSPPLEEEQ